MSDKEIYITGFKNPSNDDILTLRDKNTYTKDEINTLLSDKTTRTDVLALLSGSNNSIGIFTDLDNKPELIDNSLLNVLFTKTYNTEVILWGYPINIISHNINGVSCYIQENTILQLLYKDDSFIIIGNPIIYSSYTENSNFEIFANGNVHMWLKNTVTYSDTVEEKEFSYPVKFNNWVSKYEKFTKTNSNNSSVDRAMYGSITPNLFADIVSITNNKATIKYSRVTEVGIELWGK